MWGPHSLPKASPTFLAFFEVESLAAQLQMLWQRAEEAMKTICFWKGGGLDSMFFCSKLDLALLFW